MTREGGKPDSVLGHNLSRSDAFYHFVRLFGEMPSNFATPIYRYDPPRLASQRGWRSDRKLQQGGLPVSDPLVSVVLKSC